MAFDEQLQLGKLSVVNLRINERLHMSEELLGVFSAPAGDSVSKLHASEMAREIGVRNCVPFVNAPTYGVVITLIDPSINYSLIQTFHLSTQIFSCCWPQGFG